MTYLDQSSIPSRLIHLRQLALVASRSSLLDRVLGDKDLDYTGTSLAESMTSCDGLAKDV